MASEMNVNPVIEKMRKELDLPRSLFSTRNLNRLNKLIGEIRSHTPEEYRDEVDYVLKLMAHRNTYHQKGKLLRKQIDDLVSFDTSSIPSKWSEGHLDDAVITAERVRELNNVLRHRREPRI